MTSSAFQLDQPIQISDIYYGTELEGKEETLKSVSSYRLIQMWGYANVRFTDFVNVKTICMQADSITIMKIPVEGREYLTLFEFPNFYSTLFSYFTTKTWFLAEPIQADRPFSFSLSFLCVYELDVKPRWKYMINSPIIYTKERIMLRDGAAYRRCSGFNKKSDLRIDHLNNTQTFNFEQFPRVYSELPHTAVDVIDENIEKLIGNTDIRKLLVGEEFPKLIGLTSPPSIHFDIPAQNYETFLAIITDLLPTAQVYKSPRQVEDKQKSAELKRKVDKEVITERDTLLEIILFERSNKKITVRLMNVPRAVK